MRFTSGEITGIVVDKSRYTHPMREDVKQKHFSTPLRETSILCLHPGPFFFVERILVRTLGAPQSTTGIRIAVAGFP
jgi:hypothetical protein